MAFQLIGQPITINNYTGNMKPTLIAKYVCDTPSDLPARVQTDYIIGLGSSAYVVSNAGEYMIQTDGTWQLQVAGTVTYTKAEIDTLLSYKANASSVYTKTQTDNLLANKIVLSDVFGVGVSLDGRTSLDNLTPGNYYAPNGTVATAVDAPYTRSGFNLWVLATTSSTKKVQLLFPNPFQGDYTTYSFFYMRQNISDTWGEWSVMSNGYDVGGAIKIQTGDNLDNFTKAGLYICQSLAIAQSLDSNSVPFDGTTYSFVAFKLKVEFIQSENNIRQTLIPLYSDTGYFVRMRMSGASGTWRSWYYYGGTQVV